MKITEVPLVLIILLLAISPAMAMEGGGVVQVTSSSGGLDPVWSPDGAKIVYTSGAYDIWAMKADGTDKRQLTSEIYRDEDPAWSPDGADIVYVSEQGGDQQIWIMGADGSGKRQLTFTSLWKSAPSWSPDGTKIVYVAGRYPDYDIWVMNADGTGQRRLTFERFEDWAPAWSPDGAKIAYISKRSGAPDLWVMGADGANKRRLVENVYWKEPQLSWSPDGKRIAYVSSVHPNYDIWATNLDGTKQERLTSNRYSQITPSWSPDGTKIAYSSDESGSYEIWIMEVQNLIVTQPTDVTPSPATQAYDTSYVTPQINPNPAPISSPSEVPQLYGEELVTREDLTTQEKEEEISRNKDLVFESYREEDELIIPNPTDEKDEITIPSPSEREDEIAITNTDEMANEASIEETIIEIKAEPSMSEGDIPLREGMKDERILIALLLAIPFGILVWNSRYFTIRTDVNHRPNITLSRATFLPLVILLTFLSF
ncbi:MAG: hypothetical protein ACE5PM_03075 [Candidatus Hydrothermarchaeales archaeon]